MSCLPPPHNVSPLIKLLRYACLASGVVYGIAKQRAYTRTEESNKEYRAGLREARERETALDAKRRAEADRREMEKIIDSFSKPLPKHLEEGRRGVEEAAAEAAAEAALPLRDLLDLETPVRPRPPL